MKPRSVYMKNTVSVSFPAPRDCHSERRSTFRIDVLMGPNHDIFVNGPAEVNVGRDGDVIAHPYTLRPFLAVTSERKYIGLSMYTSQSNMP